jgi:hypothetical protein
MTNETEIGEELPEIAFGHVLTILRSRIGTTSAVPGIRLKSCACNTITIGDHFDY